jgi:hypothetical protein
MDREKVKVWVTKYALSEGILVYDEAEVCSDISNTMITVHMHGKGLDPTFHKPDWYRSEAEAKARAEAMRKAKIETLKKQINKFEKLDFLKETPTVVK